MAGQMKTIQTALDALSAGTPDASALRGRVKLPPLPEGVTRRMLTRDPDFQYQTYLFKL